MEEYEKMEEKLKTEFESSRKELDEFMTSSVRIDGLSLPDWIDIVNDIIESRDKVALYMLIVVVVYY
jgi:hypothetical protein